MSFKNSLLLKRIIFIALFTISVISSPQAYGQFSANLSSTANVCSGTDLNLNITGGTAPYTITYYQNGVQTIATTSGAPYTNPYKITVSNPNAYNISFNIGTVTDASSNYATLGATNLQIFAAPAATILAGIVNPSCLANIISISNTKGMPPFKVQATDGTNIWAFQGVSQFTQPPAYFPSGVTFTLQSITDANNCNTPLSGSISVPASPLAIVANTPATSACGTTLGIQNPASGYTYQWYYEGFPAPIGTGLVYQAFFSGKFYAVGTNTSTGPCPLTSNYINVTVTNGLAPSQPLISVSTPGPYTCGQTVALSFNGSAVYDIYIWRKNGTVIQQGSSSTLTINSTGSYDLSVQNTGGCPSQASIPYNAIFQASGFTAPVIVATAASINCWETSTISVSSGVYDTYQWLKNNVIIPGATNPTYDVTQTGGNYTVKVTQGICNSGTSNQIAITVFPVAPPALNQFATFSLSLNSGLNILTDFSNNVYDSYQWQTSSNGSTFTDIPGANLVSYTFTNSNIYYKLKVTKGACTALSSSVYAQVFPGPAVIPVSGNNAVMVMCSTGQLKADAGYSSYQWYKNNVLLTGETGNTLDVGKPANGSGNYSVKFTDSYGLSFQSLNTNNVLVLADIKPVVTVQNPGCSGETGSLIISQPSANSGVYKHYTWTNSSGINIFDFDLLKAPNTSASVIVAAGNYTLTVTDFAGCTSTQTVTVNAGAASATFTPVIAPDNGVTSLCRPNATTGINLQVTNISSLPAPAAGNVYYYGWLVNGVQAPLPPFTGFPSASLFLGTSQYNALASGNYVLQIKEVYNGYPFSPPPAGWVSPKCFGVSNAVALNVEATPNPNFTVSATSVCPNTDVTITFVGQASANTSFVWNFGTMGDYTIVSGTGTGPYVLHYATPGTKGLSLTLNNGICPVATTVRTVSVLTPTPIVIQTQQMSIYPGCQSILQVYNIRTINSWSGGPFTLPPGGLPGSAMIMAVPTQTSIYTAIGIDNSGCPTNGSITIAVLPSAPNTNFSYGASSLCQTIVTGLNPVFTGTAVNGHFFSVDQPGLASFDAYNGRINPAISVPGVYNVSNTFFPSFLNGASCPAFKTTIPITIIARPVISNFAYSLTNYCSTGGVISPSVAQTSSGSYSFYPSSGSSSPANGLALNAINGQINLANCSTGTYIVRFTAVGDPSCAPTYTEAYLSVTKYQDPSFSYPQTSYCNNVSGSQAIPNNQDIAAQYSLNPWNLNINQQNGTIDLYNANAGTYTVTKTIYPGFGACPTTSANVIITINAPKVASSFYYTNSANAFVNVFCEGTTGNLSPNFTPVTGMGTLTISPVPAQGWSSTGINMALLPSGLYTITNTLTDPQCNTTTTTSTTLTVKPKPVVVSVSDQNICSGISFNQPLSSLPAGSIFSWISTVTSGNVIGNNSASGLSINQTLSLSGGAANATVKFTITPSLNLCPGNPVDMIVTVNPIPVLIPFGNKTICSGTTFSVPLTTNITGANISWIASQTSGTVTGFASGSGSAISQTLTGSGVVTYSITSSLNGCSSVYNFVVTVNPTPALTVTLPSLNICNGSNINQTLAATPGGGYFNWTTTVTSGSLTGYYAGGGNPINQSLWLASGATTSSIIKYTVTPGLNGCLGTPADMIVTVNPIPSMATISNKTICNGTTLSVPLTTNVTGANISWTASLSSGTVAGFSSGSGSAITQTLTGSGIVSYSVTSSMNGCSSVNTFTVTVNPTPALTVTLPSLNICNAGGISQALSATPAGSSFAWTNTVTSGSLTGNGNGSGTAIIQTLWLASGATTSSTVKYTVTPSLNGCSGTSADMIVTVNPIPVLSTIANKTICSGTPLSVPLTTNLTGATVSWTSNLISGTVTGFSSGSGSSITQTLTGSGNVNYTVTASLNGCSSSTSFQVTVNPTPAVTVALSSLDVCIGTQIVYVYTKPSGFTNPVPVNIPGSSFSIATSNINSTGGVYNLNTTAAIATDISLTVTNPSTGCSTTTVNHVTINPIPVITASPLTICEGTDLSLPVTSSVPGTTFSWTSTSTGTLSGLPVSGTLVPITAIAVTGSGTKTYTINATAALCNAAPKTVVVTVNPSLPISLTVTPTTLCEGTSLIASRSFPAAGSGYTVTYTRPLGFIPGTNSLATAGGISNATESVTAGAVSGNFTLTSTSSLGCIRTSTIPVTVLPAPTVSASNITICEGSGFDIPLSSTSTGITYSWVKSSSTGTVAGFPNSGTAGHITAAAITGNGSITYTVNSVSTQCTSANLSVTVTVNPSADNQLIVSPGTVCEGGTVVVSVRIPAGYLSVYTRPTGFAPVGGAAVPGGFNEGVKAGNTSGSFVLTTTSPLGCSKTTTIPVIVLPAPNVSASNITICESAGFDIPLSSTSTGITYTWVKSSTTGTVAGFPNSGTAGHITAAAITGNGSITYTVNSVSTQCASANLSVTVTVNPSSDNQLTVSAGTVCEGGTVVVSVRIPAGYLSVYTRPTGFAPVGGAGVPGGFNEGVKAGSTSGSFVLTTTSPLGCTKTTTVPVTVLPVPIVAASNATICEGAGFDIPLTSTTGITYTWAKSSTTGTVAGFPNSGTTGHITDAVITGNGSITYNVNTTSANGCTSANFPVTLTVNPNAPHNAGFYDINSNPLVNGVTICQGTNIVFSAQTPAGYTFTYTPPSTTDFQNINGGGDPNGFARSYVVLSANGGLFTLTSVSDLGCTRTSQYQVNVNPAPSAPVINFSSSSANAICAGSSGSIGYNIEAGVDYNMTHDPGLIASVGMCGQGPTSYGCSVTWGNGDGFLTVTGTNQLGCSTTSTRFVPVQSTPVINSVTPGPLCSGGVTSIVLNSVPNNMTINYTWESFVSSGTINGLSNFASVSSGSVFPAPGFGYTIQETLTGAGSLFYNVTATTTALSGCSSQTTIFQDVVASSSPSVTVSYSPTFSGSVPQVNLIVFTASPVNCGSNPSYQWKVNGVNVAGATGSTFNNPSLIISSRGSNPDKVSCTVTSSDPCSNGVQVTSPDRVISCSVCRFTTDQNADPEQSLSVYPNPFSETIHVNIPDSFGEEVEVVIKDMKGIEVERLKTNTGEAELGQKLESGVYILQVSGKSGTETFKIVKAQ